MTIRPLLCSLAGLLCLAVATNPTAAADAAKPAPAPAPAAAPLRWAGWQIPAEAVTENGALAVVADEQAESVRETPDAKAGTKKQEHAALLRRVTRQAIAKAELPIAVAPPVRWSQLTPGLYRVKARIKFDGSTGVIGTPIQLFVRPVRIQQDGRIGGGPCTANTALAQSFYGYEFKESGQYQVVSFLYEVDPTGKKRLKAQDLISPMHMLQSLREPPPPKEPPSAGDGLAVGLTLPRTKYNPQAGLPPNSVRSVSVDWLALERVEPAATLTVRYVLPQKRWVRPGEKTSFAVGLENATAAPQTRQLRVVLVRGIDEQKVVNEQAVTLAPGESKVITVPWEFAKDAPVWGYEVRAELRAGDKTESAANDFFSVSPDAYTVHIMGTKFHTEDPYREHGSYANLTEMFGATVGDMALLTSTNEQWLGGMMSVPYSYEATRLAVQHNAALGAQTIMYLFAGGTGTPVMDLYVRKPEWFNGRMSGTDLVYRKNKEIQEMIRTFDFRKDEYPNPMTPHMEIGLNFWDPALMAMITRDTLEFVKRTGYGGIRFDVGMFGPRSDTTCYGEKLPYDIKDAMPVGARNFEQYCAALRQANPTFEFGANMDTWAYLELVGKRNQKVPPPESFPEFVAFAKAGGMFMDEGTMDAPNFGHYMNRFEDALWSMCQKREMARRFGGIYQLFSPHRDGNGYFAHDDIYWTVMILASGSYYVGSFAPLPYSDDSAGQFIIRFGEYFRSKGLRPLAQAADRILIDAPGNVWYADATVWEDIGNRRRYVIPLINAPVAERFRRNKTGEFPPPIEDAFPIDVAVPEGYKTAKAWMLTPEPRIAVAPLTVAVANGRARVQFPGVRLFRAMVMEFEK